MVEIDPSDAVAYLAAIDEAGGDRDDAGVRSQELRRLDFQKVNVPEKEITIGADIAKTRSRRLIGFDESLAAWLELCWKPSGPVVGTGRVDNRIGT